MAKKKTTTKALAPKTKPADVEETSSKGLVLPMRQAGVIVNEDTALTLGAVWACVRVISESLAGLPWFPFRLRTDGGADRLVDHPTAWLLNNQPNEETSAFQWRETLAAHALTWGNGFAEIERDLLGRPVNMWQLTPDRVEVVRFRGRIIYDVANPSAPNTVLEADEMYHLKGLGYDGLVGYPVIRLAARTIGTGISAEDTTSQFFQNDSTPGGILSAKTRLSDQARNNIRESWEKMHSGPKNRRKVAVLEEGVEWMQTGLPPEDAQLLQQRQFTPTEICRWFRVPPHKIADLTRSTNNNIEHQSIEFVNDCLRPWAERLESEADIKLYGRNNRGSIVTVIDLNELKRGDLQSQTEHIQQLSDRGIYSVNEARSYLGLNPISDADGGNKRFIQMNMQLLEKAGEEPPAEQQGPQPQQNQLAPLAIYGAVKMVVESMKDELRGPPGVNGIDGRDGRPGADGKDGRDGDDADAKEAATTAVLAERTRVANDAMCFIRDACERIAKREETAPKVDGDALRTWTEKHLAYCAQTLKPCAEFITRVYRENDAVASLATDAFMKSYRVGGCCESPAEQALKFRNAIIGACAVMEN